MAQETSLQTLLQLFQSVSGMNIAVYDHLFHHVFSQLYENNVCARLHTSPHCLDRCLSSDLEALAHVANTRKLYVYTCPFGFFEAIFPILKEGTLVGYLFIGPAICGGTEGDAEVLRRIAESAPELDLDELRGAVLDETHRSSAQLQSFCQLLAIFAEYIENHDLLIARNLTTSQLIKSYIKQHLSRKITLSQLAMALHCNTVTLTGTFRRETGITIMGYVQRERMKRATYLLRATEASIAEIAALCGISQPEYFSKCFRSAYGLSPSEWRRRVRQEGESPVPLSGKGALSSPPSETEFLCSPSMEL